MPEDYDRDESEAQRLDRNWNELVQELRVLSIGVQALFGFLLTLPFQAHFSEQHGAGLVLYLVALLSAGAAVGLLIAPVAIHRLTFHEHVKDEVVDATDRLTLAGLVALGVATTAAVAVVTQRVVGWTGATVIAAAVVVALCALWLVLPEAIRRKAGVRRR